MQTCLEEISEEKLKLFIQFGTSGSEAMLDYPCLFFEVPHIEGFIAYRLENNVAVVFGNPICPKENISQLVKTFHQFCKDSQIEIVYLIVNKEFMNFLVKNGCHIAIEVCEELLFDPTSFKKSKRLNYRINQAAKSGLVVKEYLGEDDHIEKEILNVGKEWKKNRIGWQMHLGHLNFFEYRIGKRWFYAEKEGEVIGMSMLCKIESKKGWLLKFLIAKPTSIPFVSEFMMSSLLEILKAENCAYLTYGMVPANEIEVIQGMNPFSTYIAKITFKFIKKFFKLDQKKLYWLRYHPKIEPTYVLFTNSSLDINIIKALAKAFKPE